MGKALSLLLIASSVAAEWTCDDCKEAAQALGVYTTSDDALDVQSDILVAELCPQAPDQRNVSKTCQDSGIQWPSTFSLSTTSTSVMTWIVQLKRPISQAVKNVVQGSTW